ncbi:MAG: LysR family transcriptional regulator, partial [Peptococcaceae bacterium]|nr:LysR family transcriptional regulator [Peptococcaceae bacterium]
MHTDQIRLLLDLAQTHSFNQTAERHYTTQQSISYSIKQLEKELQVKIFNRSNSGVS